MIRSALLALCLFVYAVSSVANPSNRGYSGAPGSLGRCASSCHGLGVGTVQVSGFPTDYVPDSTYLITIAALSGQSIKNFNGSVRVGTGSVTAGVITAGQSTQTYSVAQEQNGVHLSQLDRQSATFNWRAPAAGTGVVRMYVAAHQGNRDQGPNTNITLVANELVQLNPPNQASNPAPANGAENVSLPVTLSWSAATGATFYELYLGEPESLMSLGTTTTTTFTPPDVMAGMTYWWRVDAINEAGTNTGEVWSFTTEAQSSVHEDVVPREFVMGAAYPNPFNPVVRVDLSIPFTTELTARIYDRTGRLAATLVDRASVSGAVRLEWNASGHAAGLYFLKCECNGFTQTQKLVYLP